MSTYEHLFRPLRLAGLTLKNRLLSAPTSLAELGPEEHYSQANMDYYRLKAAGGCALVTVGDVIVDLDTGRSHPQQVGLDDPGAIPYLVQMAEAIHAGGAAAFVRVPNHEMAHIKPVIECGPDGVIFPMVNTAEQARQCVSICTYPPKGTRGFGPLRGIDYGLKSLDEYLETVDASMLKLMQCEHVESVNNLDEILEVPGVDAIVCGPMDLSVSINKHGQFADPEVRALMQVIIDKCKAHKKPFGLSFGGKDMDLIQFWMEQGASFLSMGGPQDYFRMMSQDIIGQVRGMKADK